MVLHGLRALAMGHSAHLMHSDNGGLQFSHPVDAGSRVKMTIRYSVNNGLTWDGAMLVYRGPAGYSQLGVLSDGDIALLYEQGIQCTAAATIISGFLLLDGYYGIDRHNVPLGNSALPHRRANYWRCC